MSLPAPHHQLNPYRQANELLKIIYARRNWSQQSLEAINNYQHPDLLDIHLLADKLHALYLNQKHLVIYPDFDMDGITSAMVAYAGFSQLGFTVSLYVPDYTKGHGFDPVDVDKIRTLYPDAAAIITTDTGISSFAGINHALTQGLEVYITDHHLETEGRSNATVIVNPGRMDETYPLTGICGAHVIFQVLQTYAATYQPNQSQLIDYLALYAGIGTVADVMPLLQENRLMVRRAISLMKLLYPHRHPSQSNLVIPAEQTTLMQVILSHRPHPIFARIISRMHLILSGFQARGKLRSPADISETFCGFYLAPTFNAIRRTQIALQPAFDLFTHPDEEVARTSLETLMDNNEYRKRLVAELTEEIYQGDQPLSPYIWNAPAGTPSGMLGLLANSIMASTQLPTVVVSGLGGSARSPLWYPLNERVNTQEGMKAIGHNHACGVRVDTPAHLNQLYTFLAQDSATTQAMLETTGQWNLATADLMLGDDELADAPLYQVVEALEHLVPQIQQLGPFGHSHEEPTVRVRLSAAKLMVRTMGSEAQHLKIITEEGLTILGWNKAQLAQELAQVSTVDVIGTLTLSTFNDITSVNLILSEMLPVTEVA